MPYKDLQKIKPLIVDINSPGRPDKRFYGVKSQVPVKEVKNVRSDMALLDLYTKGPLRFEGTGNVCGECLNYYPDPNLGAKKGRCKARGFMRTTEATPADERRSWTDPESGITFKPFPRCPYFIKRERLSRR